MDYFPIGANVCWGETWGDGGRHVFDLAEKYGIRLMLCFDAHAGKTTKSESVTVAGDQTLKIPLPEVEWDAAFRLHR